MMMMMPRRARAAPGAVVALRRTRLLVLHLLGDVAQRVVLQRRLRVVRRAVGQAGVAGGHERGQLQLGPGLDGCAVCVRIRWQGGRRPHAYAHAHAHTHAYPVCLRLHHPFRYGGYARSSGSQSHSHTQTQTCSSWILVLGHQSEGLGRLLLGNGSRAGTWRAAGHSASLQLLDLLLEGHFHDGLDLGHRQRLSSGCRAPSSWNSGCGRSSKVRVYLAAYVGRRVDLVDCIKDLDQRLEKERWLSRLIGGIN